MMFRLLCTVLEGLPVEQRRMVDRAWSEVLWDGGSGLQFAYHSGMDILRRVVVE